MALNSMDIARYVSERKDVIVKLAQQSKKDHGFSNPNAGQSILLHRLGHLLDNLENVLITPTFKQKTKMDEGLLVMFGKPGYHFRKEHTDRAKVIYEKWEADNWGAPLPIKKQEEEDKEPKIAIKSESEDEIMMDADSEQEQQTKRRRTSSTIKKQRKPSAIEREAVMHRLRYSHRDHRIWGVDGIMHGLCIKEGGKRKVYELDPRYPKRESKVYGHNGLQVGAWFPYQLSALFNGAHGHSIAGIAGSTETGAYSIVVAGGAYDELDKDHGDTILYSGSRSHNNDDPHRVVDPSQGTRTLHASYSTRKPIRVLRKSTGKWEGAPKYGFRYDGLYKVVDVREPYNTNGGRYEQFMLKRVEDQPPIDINRPSKQERRDWSQIGKEF